MPDMTRIAELRWEWKPWVPYKWGALFCEDPARVALLWRWFAEHERPEKREVLAEEVGHYLASATHGWRVATEERRRCEGRAWRYGARWLIDDEAVRAAYAAGCEYVEDFAGRWDMPLRWTARRLELYWQDHPRPTRRCA